MNKFLIGAILLPTFICAQLSSFPYRERFDSVVAPALPADWSTSTNKNPGGDFITSTSSPRSGSPPNCLNATDARTGQSVISPQFSFAGKNVDSLEFYERRTGTFTAGLLVEASIDGDTLFSISLSDTLTLTLTNNGAYQRRIVSLPETLSGRSNVRFRWRTVGVPTGGATAVLRFDDISITVKKTVDVALASMIVSPAFPTKGNQLTISIGIKNKALSGNFSGIVHLFDSLTSVASHPFGLFLASGDSVQFDLPYPNIAAGRHSLRAVLAVPGDEDTTNNFLSLVVNVVYPSRTILVNEIMYVPPSGMPEWIEIVNNCSDTIPLSGWKISDATSNKAAITPGSGFLPPHSYAVITTDTNAFKNFFETPDLLYQASFSALNNSGDAVVVYDQTGAVIDSLTYFSSWGGSSGGRSLERFDTAMASTDQANWRTSVHPKGSTPGAINSVTQKTFDGAAARIIIAPPFPVIDVPVSVTSTISNAGKQLLTSIDVKIFIDADKDSSLSESEIISHQIVAVLSAGDSVSITAQIPSLPQGVHWIGTAISPSQDDDTTNNLLIIPVPVGLPKLSIVINEIMYAPLGDMPEWIEGYNATNHSVSLTGWKISDNGTTRAPLLNNKTSVAPLSYFIITTDTNQLKSIFPGAQPMLHAAIPTLNNTTPDAVVLFDERGATMDSVYYRQSWGGTNGTSLQRYDAAGASADSANWRATFPTPGSINASVRKNYDAKIRRISANTAAPMIGHNITINAVIENIGRQSIQSFAVEFYLDNDSVPSANVLISRQIVSSLPVSDSVTLTVQKTLNRSGTQKISVTIISGEDEEHSNNTGVLSLSVGVPRGSVVITEIMYNPVNDMPEWIEFYNSSGVPISIAGWKISDNGSTKVIITQQTASILPNKYFVVTADTLFQQYFSIDSPLFFAPFPSLNNTTPDAVVIFDALNRTIDSVYYKPSWGGTGGMSLQRYDLFGTSSDSANWRSGVPSPGAENVSARKNVDVEVRNIAVSKMAEDFSLRVCVQNAGRKTAQNVTLRLYHDADRDSVGQSGELLHVESVAAILPLDSFVVQFQWRPAQHGVQQILAAATCDGDENMKNNFRIAAIAQSFPPLSVVINEIMYEPRQGMSEYVELMNRSADTVDVFGWKVMDQPAASGSRGIIPLAKSALRIQPGGFVVVAGDSSILSQFPSLATGVVIINSSLGLSNSGEDVVLVDLTDTQIDSVRYAPSWHLKQLTQAGRSLERIDPSRNSADGRNWSTSVATAGGSPGARNSIFIGSIAQNSSLSLSPNPFSPDNDGYEDFLSINYSLPTNSAVIRVRIYDVIGRLVRRLVQSEPASSAGSVIWNGLDDDGHRVRIGMYIILFEAFDNFGGTVKAMKDVAVVARKL